MVNIVNSGICVALYWGCAFGQIACKFYDIYLNVEL